MQLQDLIGRYEIVGTNQDAYGTTYHGVLSLNVTTGHSITAVWNIGDDQIQQGTGFFNDNVLVLNFHYTSTEGVIYKGTLVYKCLSKNFLQGFWFEEAGDPRYLGTENASRLSKNQELLH